MDRTLDRYELVERIAVGGMAEVFRAKAFGAHGFEKVLAIKRILPDLAQDQEFEQRFIAEAKLAVTLTHANIVQVLDFGRFGGSLYIAMEFVDGPDLAALLRAFHERSTHSGATGAGRGRVLPVGAALHVAMELAKGLDFAHQRGVVHRDISPSNILLSRAGEVKIADFGIAQAAVEAAKGQDGVLPGARRIMGKWRYMSPEQARGEKLDARSDLFSAGVVIYELLTGKKLFPGEEIEAIVRNLTSMEIPPPSSVRPDLPPVLDAVLARVLARDRTARYSTAAELLRAILEVSYQRTLVATALDVADVITDAFPPPPAAPPEAERQQAARLIDDIIRSELLGGVPTGDADDRPSTRVTARATPPSMPIVTVPEGVEGTATGAAFVKKGAGADGITLWELRTDDLTGHAAGGGVDDGVTAPRAMPAPAGAAPPDALETQPIRRATNRVARWTAGAVALALAAAGVFALARRDGSGGRPSPAAVPTPIVTPAQAIDAGLREAKIRLETDPPGATVTIDGLAWPEPTPTTLVVTPSTKEHPHVLEATLAGRRPFRDEAVVVGAGETVKYRETLRVAGTHLIVTTTPTGADADLDGRPLIGRTPLALDLEADGASHLLRLRKPGFADQQTPIVLAPGATLTIERTLEAAIRYGRIDLYVEPWADVYLNGKKIGQAPIQGLRLPVGPQRLRLVNPNLKKEMFVTVNVPTSGVGLEQVRFP